MSDPAIEAAQRAWESRYGAENLHRFHERCNEDEDVASFVTASAREALAPIRELHKRWTSRRDLSEQAYLAMLELEDLIYATPEDELT